MGSSRSCAPPTSPSPPPRSPAGERLGRPTWRRAAASSTRWTPPPGISKASLESVPGVPFLVEVGDGENVDLGALGSPARPGLVLGHRHRRRLGPTARGAWVLAIGPGPVGGAVTAADGTYTVTDLPVGTYRATFVVDGEARRLQGVLGRLAHLRRRRHPQRHGGRQHPGHRRRPRSAPDLRASTRGRPAVKWALPRGVFRGRTSAPVEKRGSIPVTCSPKPAHTADVLPPQTFFPPSPCKLRTRVRFPVTRSPKPAHTACSASGRPSFSGPASC